MRICAVLLAFFLFAFTNKQSADFYEKLVDKSIEQTKEKVRYEPAYVQMKYPNGDVPSNTGVCTDLVIRAYRGVGIDLQKEVHEDMLKRFKDYPKLWNLKKPDSNIDHRRVPNLMVYFKGKGASLKITDNRSDYKPGDVVTWNLENKHSTSGITHIGIVTDIKNIHGDGYMIAHNIGGGNVLEDMLFSYTIIGHFRFKKAD
ncbi:MAG: putative amidase domain protein [Bacteroidetes bacterium]|nr:putative amidase domain protein [Bacteroidota bacterium]